MAMTARRVSIGKITVSALAAIVLGLQGAATAAVISPGTSVAGHTQLEWSEQWWQWIMSIPKSTNPLVDPNGDNATRDNNRAVFFLAGTLGGPSGPRTLDVPAGRPIFFPMINAIDFESGPNSCFGANPPLPGTPLACALGQISGGLTRASNVSAVIDGVTVVDDANKDLFRQTSTSFFDLTLADDDVFGFNSFGFPAGFYPGSSVSDGYWVMLNGLSPGIHTIDFSGTLGGGTFSVSVTDTLLLVPEPSSVLLLTFGVLALAGTMRRCASHGDV